MEGYSKSCRWGTCQLEQCTTPAHAQSARRIFFYHGDEALQQNTKITNVLLLELFCFLPFLATLIDKGGKSAVVAMTNHES